ncbi:L,D-transpeptidase family protein [Sphingosinithalassobacter portus]|uniref:L,D-transpeptidase family protein n=1 Tax=Stakelama portus TaxID=2676234 RepID=UPI000D6DDD66|nr:L,D-transpeptidase family protein [Sphingosinithalassobacter portus]
MARKLLGFVGVLLFAAIISGGLLLAGFHVTRAVAGSVKEAKGDALAQAASPAATPSPTAIATPAPAATPQAQPAAQDVPATAPVDPEEMVVRRVLPITEPIKFGDWYWDERGAPATGTIIVTIDLKAQVLSVWRDGYEIGTTAVLYGADEKPTPIGTFPILEKDIDHVSSTYNSAPMPYSLRLTRDWVAIHASDIIAGYATHGCIGVPEEFAAKLFAATKVGDLVVITNGKTLSADS